MKRRMAGVVALVGMLLAAATVSGEARGNTYSVRNENDSGPRSLRAAITAANDRPGGDVITFAPSVRGAITLRKALPPLRAVLEIRGPGAEKLAVQRSYARGTPDFRVFTIPDGSSVTKISGLRVSNGLFSGLSGGGGIYNEGRLTLLGTTVSSNAVEATTSSSGSFGGSGGGLWNRGTATIKNSSFVNNSSRIRGGGLGSKGGRLMIENSNFSGNDSGAGGGGIHLDYSTATISGSTFSDNGAYGDGGGIENFGGTLTVQDSMFSSNDTSAYDGGGIGNFGELTVRRSTFSGNNAAEDGGAIYNGRFENSLLTVENSTFYANKTGVDNSDDGGHGGGIHNTGNATVLSSTFAANEAVLRGGGLYNGNPNAAGFSLKTTVVADNTAPADPDASGTFASEGHNLVENPSGATGFGPTDQQNVDPALDPEGPRDNGGPTQTVALLPDSPAIDAVEAGCPPPETDQRGVARPQDGDGDGAALCDVGAFEREP